MTSEMDIRTAVELIGEDAVKRLNENNLYVVHSRTLDKMASISSELIQLQKENKDLLSKLHRAQRREEGLEIQMRSCEGMMKACGRGRIERSPSWLRIACMLWLGDRPVHRVCLLRSGLPIWSSLVLALCT